MRNGWWKPIYKYNLDLKMTYENKWELKPNYKHKWRLKSTYEYKWIMKMDYKYKWDIFLDYMMKKSWYPYFHENKNPCPEFNGEKMHEHSCQTTIDNIYSILSKNRKENIIFIISFLASILNTVQNIWICLFKLYRIVL